MLKFLSEKNCSYNEKDLLILLSIETKLSTKFINNLTEINEYNDLDEFLDVLEIYSDFDRSKITGKFKHFKDIFCEMIECEI